MMEEIETATESDDPQGREMGPWEIRWSHVQRWWWRNVSRRIPRLVWYGDEIDVRVTFSEDPLCQSDPMKGLFSGGLYEIEKQLLHMGVGFDKGQGCYGRDWEWDWSLSGPIRVMFGGRAKHPERRIAKEGPKLKLVS